MKHRCLNRLLGAVAVIVPMVLAAPAVAVAPPSLDTDHAVGKALERVGAKLPKLPSAPLEQKAPSPAPAPEAPAARARPAPAPSPAPATARSSAPAAHSQAPAARAASAPRAHSSAAVP